MPQPVTSDQDAMRPNVAPDAVAACEIAGCDEPAPVVSVGEKRVALCDQHEAEIESRWHRRQHDTGLDGTDGEAPKGRLV